MVPTQRQRKVARQVARQAYIDNPGDLEAAELAFRTNRQICAIDPATVILLLKLALNLWLWWRSREIEVPHESWQDDEPYGEVTDD